MNASQLALPTAPHNGTPTSIAAARMVKVSHQEQMILSLLDRWPGLTQDKISDLTGLLRSAVSGRCNQLEYKGLIYKDGVGLTKYGRPAALYHLANDGTTDGTPQAAIGWPAAAIGGKKHARPSDVAECRADLSPTSKAGRALVTASR